MHNHQQHMIPEFYLQRFAAEDGKIWTYDTEAEKEWSALPENTATEGNLYSVISKDGIKLDLEKWIGGVENKAAPVIKKFLNAENIQGQERMDMASFIALTYVRTNAFRRKSAQAEVHMLQVQNMMIAENESYFEANIREYEEAKGKLSDHNKKILREGMLHPEKFRVNVDKQWTLKSITFHDTLQRLIYDMEWSLILSDKSYFFITSDNPVVHAIPGDKLHPFFGGGFIHEHSEVTLPLSPQACWLGHWNKKLTKVGVVGKKHIKEMNKFRAIYAEKYLYSHVIDSGIRALGKKYRDFKDEMQISGYGREDLSSVSLKRTKGK